MYKSFLFSHIMTKFIAWVKWWTNV